MNPDDPEAAVLLGSFYTLMMEYRKSWPVLEHAVKMSKGAKHAAMHQQALTNLALSNLRGGRPEEAVAQSQKLYVTESHTHSALRTVVLLFSSLFLYCIRMVEGIRV